MEKDIKELKEEIKVLEERIDILEKRERRRKTSKLLGILFKIFLYLAIIFAVWKGYEYVTNIPNMIVEKIKEKNPLNNIDFSGITGKKDDKEEKKNN